MDESREKIALLRSQGLTPKQIARRLGLQPAAVTQIVRAQAAERNASAPSLPPAVGCFVNAGWSAGLGFEGEAVAWRDLDDIDVPAFVRFEGPLFTLGPIWRIELTSPRWPK